jgi:hypothetical protein
MRKTGIRPAKHAEKPLWPSSFSRVGLQSPDYENAGSLAPLGDARPPPFSGDFSRCHAERR